MSKLVAIFENSQRLALIAVEEAQRFGHPAVDVEHLFLALALSETAAGISLREAGVTIDDAREAVQAEHDERLAALGVRDVPVPAVRMPTAGLGEIEWNERALGLFSRATGDGDGAALLQALIDEPGGFVSAVLQHLDLDPDVVLREAEPAKVAPGASAEPEIVDGGWWQVSHSAYVPASVHEVWVLLDDVTRRPEWDTALAAVRPVEPERSGRWIGEARTRPSGRGRWRVPRRARISIIERIEREECRRIAWQTTYPRLDESYDRRLRIKLEEQPRGTRVHLTLQGRRPRVLANVRLRVRCFLAASELTRLASGISRRFRS